MPEQTDRTDLVVRLEKAINNMGPPGSILEDAVEEIVQLRQQVADLTRERDGWKQSDAMSRKCYLDWCEQSTAWQHRAERAEAALARARAEERASALEQAAGVVMARSMWSEKYTLAEAIRALVHIRTLTEKRGG